MATAADTAITVTVSSVATMMPSPAHENDTQLCDNADSDPDSHKHGNGLFSIDAAGVVTFDPNGNFEDLAVGDTRDTTLTYQISDGNGGTDTATITVTVSGVNDAPVATDDAFTGVENDLSCVTIDSDPDGDTLVTQGLPAVFSIGNPNGEDSRPLTYISDGNGGTDTDSVIPSMAPVATDDAFTVSPRMTAPR